MRTPKRRLVLTPAEYQLMFMGLLQFRNKLIRNGRYPDVINELMIKLQKARKYGVRFIAVNDGVDSLDESTNDFTPFRNIMNEFYAKDSSRKLRAIFKLKAESGARLGTKEPFGYIKDPQDPKRKIIPDPDTMHIVKYIFQLCVWGKGPLQIANCLREEQVPTPTAFYYYHHGVLPGRANMDDPFSWNQRTVANILENEALFAEHIGQKCKAESQPEMRRLRKEIDALNKRQGELMALFKRLYEIMFWVVFRMRNIRFYLRDIQRSSIS